ncbi:MAG: hypothetical protein Ct9H300mP7_1340 [Verrucomicrobiota bacterium]|nr:MAG: hypothetical protein Ct9H300mP7_1340 [Verrucomicrobiota bacterium]
MLEDSAEIQMADAAYVSKKHKKKGLPPVEPLYTPEDAEYALRQFVSLGYERPIPIANGVTLTFRELVTSSARHRLFSTSTRAAQNAGCCSAATSAVATTRFCATRSLLRMSMCCSSRAPTATVSTRQSPACRTKSRRCSPAR